MGAVGGRRRGRRARRRAVGRIVVPVPHRPTDYERDAARLAAAEFVTANCFYRRDALAAAGGFDERFTAAWREDSDLFFTLLECGARLTHAPDAVVVHPIRPARWGVSLAQQRKSMSTRCSTKSTPRSIVAASRRRPRGAIMPPSPRSSRPLPLTRDNAAHTHPWPRSSGSS